MLLLSYVIYATAFRYEADAYMFCKCFFLFFFVHQTYETTVLGNGWTDFPETFSTRYRGNCSLKRRAAAWRKSCRRLANGECWWLRNLRRDSFAITRGRHRRLRYTTMSGLIDVIKLLLLSIIAYCLARCCITLLNSWLTRILSFL